MKKQILVEPSVSQTARNEKGFGLIEVMVAAAIISVIALGIATLIDDMLKMQKKSNTIGVITRMKEQIIAAVQNGRSWELTAGDADTATGNPGLDCLRDAVSMCGNGETAALNLKNIDTTPLYYASTANHGFTLLGQYCTAYPSVACPFRWNLRYELSCPDLSANCNTPDVRIRGILEYTADTVSLPGGFNPLLYEIDVRRGAEAIRNDGLTVVYVQAGTAGEGSGCQVDWVRRRLNTVTNDPANNVINKTGTALTGTNNSIELRPGTYNCRVQSPAFKNGSNRLRFLSISGNNFGTILSSSSTASMTGGSATLVLEATIVLSVPTAAVVEQRCDLAPDNGFWQGFPGAKPADYDSWSLGVPTIDNAGGYSGTTYTTVSCARTS